MSNYIARLIPFIMLGIAIVAFVFGLILLTYLFVFGAIVGLVLFAVSWIKAKLSSKKQMTKRGRTIDQR